MSELPSPRGMVIELLHPCEEGGIGLFSVTQRKKTHYYLFAEIPCEIGGRGFAVQRLGEDRVYHVRIGAVEECSCECLGFLRHGHCKHLHALLAIAEGSASRS